MQFFRGWPDDVFAEIEDFKNSDALNTQWKAFDPVKESGLLFDVALHRDDRLKMCEVLNNSLMKCENRIDNHT